MDKRFMTAQDVAEYLGISVSKAYQIIQLLNRELREKGYLTIAGKVSTVYFLEKVYGEFKPAA